MAPLEVIGAGYGRTGTDSLRIALNTLGYVYIGIALHVRLCSSWIMILADILHTT